MAASNFERMIQMAEEVFSAKNDPQQLDVDEEIISRLIKLHPACVSEFDDGNGPAIWILLIPSTNDMLNKFLNKTLGEKDLLDTSSAQHTFDSIYLCSAMTLPEHRLKGLTKRMTIDAIERIKKEHPIKNLFVWPFSKEGEILADSIARHLSMPLFKRPLS